MKISRENILVIVDVQYDFCAGGNLQVTDTTDDTDKLVKDLNEAIKIAENQGWTIVYTQDWHPVHHISFKEYGGEWPTHCVQNTPGAALHHDLYVPNSAKIIKKGMHNDSYGYSPYENPLMVDLVKSCNGCLYVAGIALEYCVKATCLDSVKLGIQTIAMPRLIRSVNPDITETTLEEYQKSGITILQDA